jgi:hypothetical protein
VKPGLAITIALVCVCILGLSAAQYTSMSHAQRYVDNIPTVVHPATPVATDEPDPGEPDKPTRTRTPASTTATTVTATATSTAPASASASAQETSQWIPDPDFINTNPVQRDTTDYGDPASTATTIGPGTTISQYADPEHTKMARCTISFTGRKADGTNIAVTAGHCAMDSSEPVRNHDAGDVVIGRYRVWKADAATEDSQADTSGFAVIELMPTVSITSDTSFGTITGVAHARAGDQVCKYGSTTRLTCGDVSYASDKSLVLKLHVEEGDSGGPVIRYTSPGADTYELVGNINANASYTNGITRALAQPLANMLGLLRTNVDEDVKIYVR